MDPSEKKISVWICQEEKLVSGLSRRTTCSDVVRVLLEDGSRRRRKQRRGRRRGPAGDPPRPLDGDDEDEDEDDDDEDDDELLQPPGLLCGPPQCYCIVEKWRGFERILPNKTRILRLWAAWGDEQENVRFVLVRSEASLPNTGPRSAEARVVRSRERPCSARGVPARPGPALTPEKQRRVVRKAFRKLAKLHGRRRPLPSPPGSSPSPSQSPSSSAASSRSASARAPEGGASVERMETLVHLVLSQDHTIRQQVQRLRELDRDIERYEAKVHVDRMRRHGANYVQDTYLVGAGAELDGPGRGQDPGAAAGTPDGGALDELARRCDDLLRLQEQRDRQEELLERLSAEIQEELNQRWMRRREEELAARPEPPEPEPEPESGPDGGELLLEHERVRTQLSTSLYIGLRLHTDLEAVKSDLDHSRQQRDSKELELRGLLQTLHALEPTPAPEDGTPGCGGGASREGRPQACAELWVDQARGLAKSCPGNDEDSDTGLSSMHSQDSDSVPVCESLV